MGKKFTSFLNSLAATNSTQRRTAPVGRSTTGRTEAPPPAAAAAANTESLASELDSPDDSDTDEEYTSNDDTDSKSTGEYYENMGFDANVQERLYDTNDSDAVSRTSDSSTESNASIIEAEVRFFVETDADFLKSLQSLEEDREHLEDAETPQFIRENLILLFMQIKALIKLHRELHAEFERSSHDLQWLSEVIIKHEKDYENYVYFMENIPTVDRILNTHKDYFKTHMPELPEKLRKPRMRLHYYVLTLETLHKKCTISEEKTALQRAINVLKVPLKKADSKLFLGAVTGSPFDLSNYGNVIRHSDLKLRRGGDLQRRVYHVLALKTLILLTISDGRNYRYITSFRMDEVRLGKQERGVLFFLEVRNGPRGQIVHYTFKAKNINMQQLWINDLKEILKEKSQPSTPRNSFVEGDSELRLSGRRSKARRRQSSDRMNRSVSEMIVSDSDIVDDENVRAGGEGSATWSGRRTAIKYSSASGRNQPARQHSGYASDSESSSTRWRNVDAAPPLAVWAIYPELEDLYKRKTSPDETQDSHQALMRTLVDEERKYIQMTNKKLGSFLDQESRKPPLCLFTHLRHLYAFHSDIFLPLLDKAASSGKKEEVAQCFIDCSDKLKELYSNYLADLIRFDDQIRDMTDTNYSFPEKYIASSMKCLGRLQTKDEPERSILKAALSMLRECVADANTILLTESVCGAPFDLDECGPLLLEGHARVRATGQVIRQDLHIVLLDTMILLLEYRSNCYHYMDAIRMDTVGLGPAPDEYSFQLEVRTAANKTRTYTFRMPTRGAKKQWLDEITGLLKLQVERLKAKQKRRLANEAIKMKTLEVSEDSDLHSVAPRTKVVIETDL